MTSFLLAGGGTAGHANPLIATAVALRARGHRVAALGTATGLEAELAREAGIEFHVVDRVPFPRKPSAAMLRVPGKLRAAVGQASAAISAVGADAVIGFGGYVSTPAYVAAWRRGIAVVVHEGNARPGLANRLGARFAAAVAVTFEGTPLRGAVHTGLPLREAIVHLAGQLNAPADGDALRVRALAEWGWPAEARTLLVTGGSTGAASLNAATAAAIADLTEAGIHVLHLTGRGKDAEALAAREALAPERRGRYVVRDFLLDMTHAFAAADAVVCRAGASTVCEVTALGIPAVYVPLPHGNGEQALNARGAIEVGAAMLLPDAELTAARLTAAAERLVLDDHARALAREAAARIGIVDAAERLADLAEEAVR